MIEDVKQTKVLVKIEIVNTINRICTGNAGTCSFGYCKFNGTCAKPFYETESLPDKLRPLKAILKNAKRKKNKLDGAVKHPTRPKVIKEKPDNSIIIKRATEILGQDIFSHYLVINHPSTIIQIEYAKSMSQIVRVLEHRYKSVHQKSINLPGKGRDYYKQFIDE